MGEEKHDSLSIEKYREQLDIWYKGNNIIREKSELYYDFISSLINLIDETYLGSDIISTQEDMINHFMWCFQKVASNFEKERIYGISYIKDTILLMLKGGAKSC
jgi:hypothetical protein